jgi:predicted nucleic acid-binding protein
MLLDTDILVDLMRGKKEARDFLSSLPEDSPHCCSTITIAEIHSGMREGERQKTTELIESLIILPVTREIAEMAGKFRRQHNGASMSIPLKRQGRKVKSPEAPEKLKGFELELDDCLIAATAAVEGLELATRNKRHYPMPEVRVKPAL